MKSPLWEPFIRQALSYPSIRNWAWRLSRSLYCVARGEQRVDDMRVDGELRLQSAIISQSCRTQSFVALDIGANEGEWTLALLNNWTTERPNDVDFHVHIFEPVETTRSRLTLNLQEYGHFKIDLNTYAVSDSVGQIEMAIMSNTGGTNTAAFDALSAKSALGFISVPTTTIDAYAEAQALTHIDVVKCDTEGHDFAVIRGAENLLSNGSISVFQFEYNSTWISSRTFLRDVFVFLEDKPYVLARIMPHHLEVIKEWNPELEKYFQSNYALVHIPVLSSLPHTIVRLTKNNTYRRSR